MQSNWWKWNIHPLIQPTYTNNCRVTVNINRKWIETNPTVTHYALDYQLPTASLVTTIKSNKFKGHKFQINKLKRSWKIQKNCMIYLFSFIFFDVGEMRVPVSVLQPARERRGWGTEAISDQRSQRICLSFFPSKKGTKKIIKNKNKK